MFLVFEGFQPQNVLIFYDTFFPINGEFYSLITLSNWGQLGYTYLIWGV